MPGMGHRPTRRSDCISFPGPHITVESVWGFRHTRSTEDLPNHARSTRTGFSPFKKSRTGVFSLRLICPRAYRYYLGGWAGPVSAQGTSVAGPPIEEIIVTARKRDGAVARGAGRGDCVFRGHDPGSRAGSYRRRRALYTGFFILHLANGRQPAADRPAIRGLTTIRNGIANTSAATTFIDGVYVGGSAQSAEFYNLKRIEVLRGPQAALYGRGTYAGAINYVTRQADQRVRRGGHGDGCGP